MQSLGSECIRHVHSDFSTACGEMEYLAHRGVAKIVGRQSILRLGNLLRSSPCRDPELRFGSRLRVQSLARRSDDRKDQKNRAAFQSVTHLSGDTMSLK